MHVQLTKCPKDIYYNLENTFVLFLFKIMETNFYVEYLYLIINNKETTLQISTSS